jgi:hypothetical protein
MACQMPSRSTFALPSLNVPSGLRNAAAVFQNATRKIAPCHGIAPERPPPPMRRLTVPAFVIVLTPPVVVTKLRPPFMYTHSCVAERTARSISRLLPDPTPEPACCVSCEKSSV